jgi:lipoprotein-anchoring transpeptidase ErfK/SrfK
MVFTISFTAAAAGVPGKVTGLTSTVTAQKATLKWDSASGAHGYYAYIQDTASSQTMRVKVGNSRTATFTGLTPATSYSAWVEGYNGSGTGEASEHISLTTLGKSRGKSMKDVHPMYFSAYTNTAYSGIAQGTKVTVTDKSYLKAEESEVLMPNGDIRYIPEMYLTYTGCLNERGDYSRAVKEGFINKKGVGSATQYLVWISTNYQKFYVFEGSAGNWTLIRTYKCTTGSFETPTKPGFGYRVKNKIDKVSFDEYSYGKYGIYFFQFIHSWPYYKGSETQKVAGYGTLGSLPQSHGCVRLKDDAALWCYTNLPMDTRIVVY